MKTNRLNLRLLALTLCMLIIIVWPSCIKDDFIYVGDSDEIPEFPGLDIIKVNGIIQPIEGSLINVSNIVVQTFAGESRSNADGTFEVAAVDGDNFQIILCKVAGKENIAYIGIHDPVGNTLIINDTTTALGLTILNPLMVYAQHEHITGFLDAVRNNNKFPELIANIRNVHHTNPNILFDIDANPTLYQLSFMIMKETMEYLGNKAYSSKLYEKSSAPTIENATGSNINFVNPRHVWYAAAIHPNNGPQHGLVHIQRVKKLVSFQFAWPPVALLQPEITSYDLGDGYFAIHMAMGLNISKITHPDAIGRGTLLNTGQAFLYILKIALGFAPDVNIANLPDYITISPADAFEFSEAMLEGDVPKMIMTFCDILAKNAEGIGYWIWQEYQNNAASNFVRSIGGIVKNAAFVLKILGFVNEEVPFFYDLIKAPREVTYYITQSNGEIIDQNENNPPVASFSITPSAGIIGIEFVFDASPTVDDNDSFEQLKFRWDLNGNGNWDYNWGFHPEVSYTYDVNGSYNIVLEVRDTHGLIGSATQRLNVGGGAGTANRVKLFQDNLPWHSDAMENMLIALGFTPGTGEYQYQIIPSSNIANTILVPGQDLVIIANDQNQTFYNNYAANQIRFNNFVYHGGSLFWEACDEGWAYGSIAQAGIILPGNVFVNLNISNYNYIVNPNLPLVAGLPNEMWHNYASHENFSNIPEGTIVYTIDDKSLPTLIEFNLGQGWVLISGQPLEHQYVYGNDMKDLLPRIVSHFTGHGLKDLPKIEKLSPLTPSHIKR